MAHGQCDTKASCIEEENEQDDRPFCITQTDSLVPGLSGRSKFFALFAPDIVNQSLLAKAGKDVCACVNAFSAMDALDLIGRGSDIDSHVAHAYAFLALDTLAILIAIMNDQRISISQHPLQITVWTHRRTEALSEKDKVQQRQ